MNDKQFTDELFKRMYDLGYRKVEIEKGHIFFYGANTFMTMWIPRVPVACTCFETERQSICIGEYLGIVEWEKVEVDTPIMVRNFDEENWKRMHFCKFENGRVFAWPKGRTSFTCGKDWGIPFEQAELVEVE